MKSILLAVYSFLLMVGNTSFITKTSFAEIVPCKAEATCYGNFPCHACTSCSYCRYCNSGGSCGVCSPYKRRISQKPKAIIFNQCKAITKKGTRCKRAVRSNGFCWQHGG